MTYQASNLSPISYANGFTMWHYRTPDRMHEIVDHGYFNEAHKMLRPGDFMCVNAGIERSDCEIAIFAVTINRDGAVGVLIMAEALR